MSVTMNAKGTSNPTFQVSKNKDGGVEQGYSDFKTTATIADAVGRLKWNDGDGTLEVGLKGGASTLQIGQENIVRIYNNTGAQLNDGQVVYVTGAQGQRPTVALADADLESTSSRTIGVVTENIANATEGFVTTFGLVRGLNTDSFNEGDTVYISSTAGSLTNVKPTFPMHSVIVGYVVRKHAAAGSIFVNVSNGLELNEIHDMNLTSVQPNQMISRNAANTGWENTVRLVWDEVNDRLGVGTTTPQSGIEYSVDPLWTIGSSPTPTAVSSDTGGVVPVGTYYFKIVAIYKNGSAAGGVESNGATVTTSTGSVALSWTHAQGALYYQVYRTTTPGTYTSPSLIGFSSGTTFSWTGTNVSSGVPGSLSQSVQATATNINDVFTTIGSLGHSFGINRVSGLTANNTTVSAAQLIRNSVYAENPYNHGASRGLQIANVFGGSGTVGALQGILASTNYCGTGSSTGAIQGGSFAATYQGGNTITIANIYGNQSSANVTSAGRATNLHGAANTASVSSVGEQSPTAGTIYGTYSTASHSSIGKTVDNMYGVWGLANATASNGTVTRIQGGFFQASVGNGTGGSTVTSGTHRALEGWAFQNNTGITDNLEGALFTASSYGKVNYEITGSKSIGENQGTAGNNPLIVGSRMYALNYQSTDTMYGGIAEVQHNANNFTYSARGFSSAVINNSGGTIDDARGYNVSVINTSGTINNAYGLYLGSIQGTSKWGVYQEDVNARNYFGGKLLVGTTTDDTTNKLQLWGNGALKSTGSASDLKFYEGSSGANYVRLIGQEVLSSDYTLTLPAKTGTLATLDDITGGASQVSGLIIIGEFTNGVEFTAGTSTQLTLASAETGNGHFVFFDGIKQFQSQYSISGTTVTFNTAIPLGVQKIEITRGIGSTATSAPTTTKTSNYTATAADYTIRCDSTSGALTITLPTAVGNTGKLYNIKKVAGGNNVTIATTSSQTIDGSLTIVIQNTYDTITVQSNGTGWDIL